MRKSKYPKNPKTFGEILIKKRIDMELSMKSVSEMIEISESYLSRIENGKQTPSVRVINDLLGLYNGDAVEWILRILDEEKKGRDA